MLFSLHVPIRSNGNNTSRVRPGVSDRAAFINRGDLFCTTRVDICYNNDLIYIVFVAEETAKNSDYVQIDYKEVSNPIKRVHEKVVGCACPGSVGNRRLKLRSTLEVGESA